MEEIEELDDENCEIETRVEFDLNWTCSKCKEDNTEYDIPVEQLIICTCNNCGKNMNIIMNHIESRRKLNNLLALDKNKKGVLTNGNKQRKND